MHDALQQCVKDLQGDMEVSYWKIKEGRRYLQLQIQGISKQPYVKRSGSDKFENCTDT